MTPTDEILMEEIARGHTSRLGELYERYKSPVFGFLLNRTNGDRATAEDLLHTTFERILRYRRSWQPGQSFRTWVFTIARNAWHDHGKASGRLPLSDRAELPELSSEPEEESPVDYRRALAALPDAYRVVVELAWQRNMKYADIAAVLGTTEANVKVRMHRACKTLRANYHKTKGV